MPPQSTTSRSRAAGYSRRRWLAARRGAITFALVFGRVVIISQNRTPSLFFHSPFSLARAGSHTQRSREMSSVRTQEGKRTRHHESVVLLKSRQPGGWGLRTKHAAGPNCAAASASEPEGYTNAAAAPAQNGDEKKKDSPRSATRATASQASARRTKRHEKQNKEKAQHNQNTRIPRISPGRNEARTRAEWGGGGTGRWNRV